MSKKNNPLIVDDDINQLVHHNAAGHGQGLLWPRPTYNMFAFRRYFEPREEPFPEGTEVAKEFQVKRYYDSGTYKRTFLGKLKGVGPVNYLGPGDTLDMKSLEQEQVSFYLVEFECAGVASSSVSGKKSFVSIMTHEEVKVNPSVNCT